MDERFSIGIDLGTSNSVAAFCSDQHPEPRVIPTTQLMAPSALGERDILPSALYLPNPSEFSSDSLALPWSGSEEDPVIIGSFARQHGALVPDRLVSSAKSWLCNQHVDRRSAILPWKSQIENGKCSPIDASRQILSHLRGSIAYNKADLAEDFSLEASQVVLTVPASFDEVARQLTHEAAQEAGWGEVVLLEEPQAAFYSWIAASDGAWREQVNPGDIVLVCDVGGGTADFSLIAVSEVDGNLQLNRISVGDHILLGGDNMDLALAYTVLGKLEAEGQSIDDWQFLAIVQLVRDAKERLFSDDQIDEVPISIPGRGSSLFASTISSKITREQSLAVILDGYFPWVDKESSPEKRQSAGLQEYGLPYASDPALSKHLARFLRDSLTNVKSDPNLREMLGQTRNLDSVSALQPNAVLFNGGVFKAPLIRERILGVLREWNTEQDVVDLQGGDLDLAVSRGAAYYGHAIRRGEGLRIKAGTARSFYIGVEKSMPAVPGFQPPVNGLCMVPQGTEEGTELVLEENEFGLVTGEPVAFRFFSSTTRAGDLLGAVVANAATTLDESPQLEITLPADGAEPGEVLPVKLHSVVTELGTLELWMEHEASQRKWKLEFNLRGTERSED